MLFSKASDAKIFAEHKDNPSPEKLNNNSLRGAALSCLHEDISPHDLKFEIEISESQQPCTNDVLFARLATAQLCASIIAQIDFLVYRMIGPRMERDLYAPNSKVSYTKSWGSPKYGSPPSTVFGLHYPGVDSLSETTRLAIACKAAGVFILPDPGPDHPDHPSTLQPCAVESKIKDSNYFSYLSASSMLTLMIKGNCLVNSTTGKTLPTLQQPEHGMIAFVVKNKWIGKMRPRRKEKLFVLNTLSMPGRFGTNFKLGLLPLSVPRCSPDILNREEWCAQKRVLDTDTSEPLSYFDVTGYDNLPTYPSDTYNVERFRKIAQSYPFPDVAELALECVSDGVDPAFAGNLQCPVIRDQHSLTPEERDHLEKIKYEDKEKGWVAGPFPRPPFPSKWSMVQPRITPEYTVPKNKWDPTDPRKRTISDFSAGETSSINQLCWSPKLIAPHATAVHIRLLLALLGKNARAFTCDIPHCFRNNRVNSALYALFVYGLPKRNPKDGTDYWVDLRNPFGWAPSEWAWACVTALILWSLYLQLCDYIHIIVYVDNYFLFGKNEHVTKNGARIVLNCLHEMGLQLHEVQDELTKFDGLGWQWYHLNQRPGNLGPGWMMRCSKKKYPVYLGLLKMWSGKTALNLKQIRQACGVLEFIRGGWPWAAVGLSPVYQLRTRGDEILRKRKQSKRQSSSVVLQLSKEASTSLLFWCDRFEAWGKTGCAMPVIAPFSPHTTWQYLIRVDASLKGWGGFILYVPTTDKTPDQENHVWCKASYGTWSTQTLQQAKVVERESTLHLEALAAWMSLCKLAGECCSARVQLETDSANLKLTLDSGYTPTASQQIIKRIWLLIADQNLILRTEHIAGDQYNKIAHYLSHIDVDRAKLEAEKVLPCPLQFCAGTPWNL